MHYRLDLLDFFRGKYSWRKLRVLLDHLPSWSAFSEARLSDVEFAEQVERLALETKGPPPGPALSEFTPQVAMLADIMDRLGDVVVATISAQGGKPPEIPRTPRPRTAVDRLRAQRDRERHESLVSEVRAAQERWRAADQN